MASPRFSQIQKDKRLEHLKVLSSPQPRAETRKDEALTNVRRCNIPFRPPRLNAYSSTRPGFSQESSDCTKFKPSGHGGDFLKRRSTYNKKWAIPGPDTRLEDLDSPRFSHVHEDKKLKLHIKHLKVKHTITTSKAETRQGEILTHIRRCNITFRKSGTRYLLLKPWILSKSLRFNKIQATRQTQRPDSHRNGGDFLKRSNTHNTKQGI